MNFVIVFVASFLIIYTQANNGNCDYKGTLIYEDLACKPVIKEGQTCPIKYECNFEVKNDTCMFRGRRLQFLDSLSEEEASPDCFKDCTCQSTSTIECKDSQCTEEYAIQVKEGCYRKYELGKCCPVGQLCPTESSPPLECKINGSIWIQGEKYYPDQTCLECVCQKEFEGQYDPSTCIRRTCSSEMNHGLQVHTFCAPYYTGFDEKVLCCPADWVCPTKNDNHLPANPKADTSSNLTCKFGEKTLKLGEKIQSELTNHENIIKQIKCECILPPLLTCRDMESNANVLKYSVL